MCGGKGTRLESSHEKPLHSIDGVAMVDRVYRALERSRIETVYAAVSQNAPETRAHLETDATLTTIETAGDGYVSDLVSLLERPDISTPVLTVAADLPALEAASIDRILERHAGRDASRTVCVPVSLKRRLGVSVDSSLESREHLTPTGVNVVGDTATEQTMTDIHYDPRLAINVNRREDARVATRFLRSDEPNPETSGTARSSEGP
ncbi:NTP transferase domain-containing protein [Natronorubrum daqingense]|uniref:Adenosylcobinamide-phosphate guanylyltransferase n=1 Tax=Natronorubrum daqingense TaxID=588898 RepID=A0A1N7CFR6_9EURY|nr:NTP transferase domain-containing protein [Natronorubrum daqingense]APX96886.1 cobalamin biosynthesis protein CobY [Natronorubrum daqingense]SIR62481.1 adenosylcobinamide-phosphate guanylyltransferase [Natronorubrum daqingense]